jgi:hypothetical protein
LTGGGFCLAAGYHAAGKLDLALPLDEETFKLRKASFPTGPVGNPADSPKEHSIEPNTSTPRSFMHPPARLLGLQTLSPKELT